MTDPMDEFDAAQERLREIVDQARANTARAKRVADEARTAEATARSPRGELTVTSRAGGIITGIQFTDAAMDLAPHALAQLTVATIAQAQNVAALRFAESAGEQFGADSPAAEELRADAQRAFPSPDNGLRY